MRHLQARGMQPARTLEQAAIVPEVQEALVRWVAKTKPEMRGVLIGGLALSMYAPPRYTQDVDLLYLKDEDIPEPDGFKKLRGHSQIDKKTHVEVETVVPGMIHLPIPLAKRVLETAVSFKGCDIKVASMEAMIALKLHAAVSNVKRKSRDSADIQAIIEHNPTFALSDMQSWNLPVDQRTLLVEIYGIAHS